MVAGSTGKQATDLEEGPEATNPEVKQFSPGEELDGKLAHSEDADRLMRSVLENDKETIEEGMALSESINQGLQSFSPDLMFEQLTKNYRHAKQLYGERLIRAVSGYDPGYIEKNIRVPEFKRALEDKLQQGIKTLQEKKLIGKDGVMTDLGLTLASISITMEELEKINRKGMLGERTNKARSPTGEKSSYKNYNSERYHDLALKASIKKAIRRTHTKLLKEDLLVHEREAKEKATIIYAVDASGSMKGQKIAAAKRAGIALAFKATRKNDDVGMLIFGKHIEAEQAPTKDFLSLIKTIVQARAAAQTDIAATIERAITTLTNVRGVKHLVLLTDGLQTVGKDPAGKVLAAASKAREQGITISVIGLSLDKEGETLLKQIVDVGKGTLYLVKDYEELDVLVLEDYYKARH